jgi:hypothetical protein
MAVDGIVSPVPGGDQRVEIECIQTRLASDGVDPG